MRARLSPTSWICFSIPVTMISSGALPARDRAFSRELARDQLRAQRHQDHHDPGRNDSLVELDKAVLPVNLLIGSEIHSPPPSTIEVLLFNMNSRKPSHKDTCSHKSHEAASNLRQSPRETK